MDSAHGGPLGGSAGRISQSLDLLAAITPLGRRRAVAGDLAGLPGATQCERNAGLARSLSRCELRTRQRGGDGVGKTKRGKGTKWMVVVDGQGLPLGSQLAPASPAEVTLAETTLDAIEAKEQPERVIADRAYDSDPLREALADRGLDLICPHRSNRTRPKTQDGRKLRRYRRRWIIERTFAWLGNFRRLVVRWERTLLVYRAFFHLACCSILLRWL
jgi:transposase